MYKNQASRFQHENTLELRFLSLVNPTINKLNGYEDQLLKRVIEVAQEKLCSKISVCFPNTDETSLLFCTTRGFYCITPSLSCDKPNSISMIYHIYDDMRPKTKKVRLENSDADCERNSLTAQYHCSLRGLNVDRIREGQQTYVGKINHSPFSNFKVGDIILWKACAKTVKTKILNISEFDSFEQMIKSIGFKKFASEAEQENVVIEAYNKMDENSKWTKSSKALAFQLEVIEHRA